MRPLCCAAVLVALTGLLPSATHAHASLEQRPTASLYADGTILAAAATSDRIYVGGDFTLIGRPTGSWVAVGPDGAPLSGRPSLRGIVGAAVPDGRGGWFVAGTINAVGVVGRVAQVVHLHVNGELDRKWRVSFQGGDVYALLLRGPRLFIGGSFKRVDGRPRPGLVAVNPANGRVLTWHLPGNPLVLRKRGRSTLGEIDALAIAPQGRTLYVGGVFNHIGKRPREGLAEVTLTSGRLTRWNPTSNGGVYVIAPGPSTSAVYVAGGFTRIGGRNRNALAAVDARTGRALPFNARVPAYESVSSVVVARGVVYAAGGFTSLGGRSRHLLAALDPRTGAATGWEPSVSGDEIDAMTVDPSRRVVYIGGKFVEVGGLRRDTLASVDTETGAATQWDPATLGDINVLTTAARGVVFAGGDITFVGGRRRNGLASMTPDGGITDWNPALEGTVRALALDSAGSRLYVGGAFAPGDAPAKRNLAVVDLPAGPVRAFGGGTNSGVWALARSGDGTTLFVGGAFVTIAGKRRTRLAALDGRTGDLLPWNSGANDLVRTLVATDDGLYAGGDFRSAGGEQRPSLARLDLDTGAAQGWNPEADDGVWSMAVRDRTLYVGGEFGAIGGKTRNALAALDVESGQASSWDPNVDSTVRSLGLSPDQRDLFAAGEFAKIGSARRVYAEFTLPPGVLTGWSPTSGFDGYSIALAPDGSFVAIAGDGGVDIFR